MQGNGRHILFYRIVRWFIAPGLKAWFRMQAALAPRVSGPCIVIANHTTDWDGLFVSLSFPDHLYFVASEHIFRSRLARGLLRYWLDPIAKRKGGADVGTAMQMLRRLRAGSSVCLFAEGNKSWHGETCPVHPATGTLVKSAGVTLMTYRLEGGYFTSPRWAHTLRRGRMKGSVVRVYPPAQLAAMSAEAINHAIAADIEEDAYQRQQQAPVAFRGKRLAEGIQNTLYLCPRCQQYGTLEGRGDTVACSCGLTGIYTPFGLLQGEGLPFTTLLQWGQWQRETLYADLAQSQGAPVFADDGQTLLRIAEDHSTQILAQGTLTLGSDGLRLGAFHLPLPALRGLEIYGRNTIVFSDDQGARYQVQTARERSALKYFEAYAWLGKGRG